MTARVTTLRGEEAGGYYLDALPHYYTEAGEPPGRWYGALATQLGLTGQVDEPAFVDLMAGRNPLSGGLLGRAYGKNAVRGYDVTFLAPKSVSVLWAVAGNRVQGEVEAAHDAAVDAVLGFVERQAHTRVCQRGQVVQVDASGLAVAVFRHLSGGDRGPRSERGLARHPAGRSAW